MAGISIYSNSSTSSTGTYECMQPAARAVAYFANGALGRGWSSWCDYVDNRARKVANMERGLKRISH